MIPAARLPRICRGAARAPRAVMPYPASGTIPRHRAMGRLNETGGGYFTWAGHALPAFGVFRSSHGYNRARRRLLLVTALPFAYIVARPGPMIAPAGP